MITCLAIDDDPIFLKTLEMYLEEFDSMKLLGTYTNPIEGVMAVVKTKPDVLLLDLEMPYLHGVETLQSLDNLPKIIVISGHPCPEVKGVRMDHFIDKQQLVKNPTMLEQAIHRLTAS